MARSKYKKHEADSSLEEQFVSRSAKKRESDAMKALGMKLAELSVQQLKAMELGETLFNAVTAYQSITSNSAKRRQRGYIGGLLREDPDAANAIEARFTAITQHDADAKRVHHQLEEWRERLIADDSALTDFLDLLSKDDGAKNGGAKANGEGQEISAQELRTLIRRVRTAKDDAQRKKATKLLYRRIASIPNLFSDTNSDTK